MERQSYPPEGDVYDREESCRRAIRTVARAIGMRLLVLALAIWAFVRGPRSGLFVGLLLLVAVITLSALPILLRELFHRRREWKELLAKEESET